MLYHLYLPPSWIISQTAKKVYTAAAIAAVFLWLGVLIPSTIATDLADGNLAQTPVLRLVLLVVMFVGVLCAALVWAAMWYFWFQYDSVNTFGRVVCLFFLALLGPLGALVYFYFVYRKSPIFAEKPTSPTQSENQAIAKLAE